MKILTRYILKEMVTPTLLGFIFYTSLILMRSLFDLAGMIIRRSLSGAVVGKLLLLSLPHIVVLTVPMSLLFGILIAIGRLSSDSEIIAMKALGISTRGIYRPVFFFSFVMFLVNLYLINVVMPRGNTQLSALKAEIFTSTVEKEIKPRVFYDAYENLMIYINDVDPRSGQWKGVFVADSRTDESQDATTPAQAIENAKHQDQDSVAGALSPKGNGGQRIIVAKSGSLSIVKRSKQVWMNLRGAETHVWDPRRPDRYDQNRNEVQRVLLPDRFAQAEPASGKYVRSLREMNLRELWWQVQALRYATDKESYNVAWVEIHKKFAFPVACIAFGVLGLPLGITNRRGGKSSGFSLSIAIIVFYYVMINNGEALATSGRVPPGIAMWGANFVLFTIGIFLLRRANKDSGQQRERGALLARIKAFIGSRPKRIRQTVAETQVLDASRLDLRGTVEASENEERGILGRLDITFPNILDRYILRQFAGVLLLVLLSTAVLFLIVDYTELAADIRTNHIPLSTVLAYFRFSVFQILHWTLPISVLVSTLVTFAIMSKNNEVTAFKSSGISLFRIAAPVVAVAALVSLTSYLILDFVLPYAVQRAERTRNVIKGKKNVTVSQQKLWLLGKGRYLINYLSFDRDTNELSQVQVFEFHPSEFRMTRRIYAQRVRWNGQSWVFSNGWMRSFLDNGESTYTPIKEPIALYYQETPDDFANDVKSPDEMTFAQLRRYIDSIRKSGYAAENLSVKLYVKTSWPFLSLIMALIALPFAFRVGKRGALYGVTVALVLGIVYWMIFAVFTKFGEVGNLPPILSAWSANILFAIAAIYMFLHVET
jgi:LPS export ABC transporter permease LptG